jgi:hypothetical protein
MNYPNEETFENSKSNNQGNSKAERAEDDYKEPDKEENFELEFQQSEFNRAFSEVFNNDNDCSKIDDPLFSLTDCNDVNDLDDPFQSDPDRFNNNFPLYNGVNSKLINNSQFFSEFSREPPSGDSNLKVPDIPLNSIRSENDEDSLHSIHDNQFNDMNQTKNNEKPQNIKNFGTQFSQKNNLEIKISNSFKPNNQLSLKISIDNVNTTISKKKTEESPNAKLTIRKRKKPKTKIKKATKNSRFFGLQWMTFYESDRYKKTKDEIIIKKSSFVEMHKDIISYAKYFHNQISRVLARRVISLVRTLFEYGRKLINMNIVDKSNKLEEKIDYEKYCIKITKENYENNLKNKKLKEFFPKHEENDSSNLTFFQLLDIFINDKENGLNAHLSSIENDARTYLEELEEELKIDLNIDKKVDAICKIDEILIMNLEEYFNSKN